MHGDNIDLTKTEFLINFVFVNLFPIVTPKTHLIMKKLYFIN